MCTQLFLERGCEAEAILELESVAEAASWIQDLHINVQLTLDRPYPDLTDVVLWLRQRPRLVRLVQIHLERAPTRLYKEVHSATSGSSGTGSFSGLNVDPMEMLSALSSATAGAIAPTDFIPLSVGRVVEPLLEVCCIKLCCFAFYLFCTHVFYCINAPLSLSAILSAMRVG